MENDSKVGRYRETRRRWKLANRDKCIHYDRKWKSDNRELMNSRRRDAYHRDIETSRAKQREKNMRNREKGAESSKAWRSKNPDYMAKWMRNRRSSDISFRLSCQLRSRMNRALRGQRKSRSASILLGCSLQDFRMYLESKFEPEMSWENYGRNGWHIDHIMPCAIFDLSKPEHQRRCFHFSNMQPLWAKDNHKKRCSVTMDQFELL